MPHPKSKKKVGTTVSKTTNNTGPVSSLRAKLKAADPEIQHYIAALEAENMKFQRQVGKMQAENTTLNNRIIILKENTNECCVHKTPPIECLKQSLEQTQERLKAMKEERRKLEQKLR